MLLSSAALHSLRRVWEANHCRTGPQVGKLAETLLSRWAPRGLEATGVGKRRRIEEGGGGGGETLNFSPSPTKAKQTLQTLLKWTTTRTSQLLVAETEFEEPGISGRKTSQSCKSHNSESRFSLVFSRPPLKWNGFEARSQHNSRTVKCRFLSDFVLSKIFPFRKVTMVHAVRRRRRRRRVT